MSVDYFGYIYATAVMLGGIVGYAKAGSIPSLGAGLLFGSLLTYGAYQFGKNPGNYHISLISSIALAGIMGARYFSTGKFMPAGLVAGISIIMAVRLSSHAFGFASD